jgi:hypothetical protein
MRSGIARPASSPQLAEVLDRFRSFGGYNASLIKKSKLNQEPDPDFGI